MGTARRDRTPLLPSTLRAVRATASIGSLTTWASRAATAAAFAVGFRRGRRDFCWRAAGRGARRERCRAERRGAVGLFAAVCLLLAVAPLVAPQFEIAGVVVGGSRGGNAPLDYRWSKEQLGHLPFAPSQGDGRAAADLFCGIGGWTWALRLLGYHVLVALDSDKRVLKHYRRNHPGVDAFCFNLRLITAAAKLLDFYGLLFLMCISPPCQGFSTASGEEGRRDRRRELIVCAAKIVVAMRTRPLVLCFENVVAMIRPPGKDEHGDPNGPAPEWLEARSLLEAPEVGYRFYLALVDSSRLGVPQRRFRWFIIACRRGVDCDFRPLELLDGQPQSFVSDYFGGVVFYFLPKEWPGQGVYGADAPMRCLRAPCATYPAHSKYTPHRRDFGYPVPMIQHTARFRAWDYAVIQGLPPAASIPPGQTAGMRAIANSVIPICGAAAIGCICWSDSAEARGAARLFRAPSERRRAAVSMGRRRPLALAGGWLRPACDGDSDDDGGIVGESLLPVAAETEGSAPTIPRKCRGCAGAWSPSPLSLRAIGRDVGGINHVIGKAAGTHWHTLDFDEVNRLLSRGGGELIGLRLMIVCLEMSALQMKRAVLLCRRIARATDGIGVIVATRLAYEAAIDTGGCCDAVDGECVNAFGSRDWVCAHKTKPDVETDAWAWCGPGVDRTFRPLGTMAGLRRQLRGALSYTLSIGARMDATRTAVLQAAKTCLTFGARAVCSSGARFAAGDPYFDSLSEYLSGTLTPVGVQGVLDTDAMARGDALPARVADGPDGEPAFGEEAAEAARTICPAAADLDAHAFDEMHMETCAWCAAEFGRRLAATPALQAAPGADSGSPHSGRGRGSKRRQKLSAKAQRAAKQKAERAKAKQAREKKQADMDAARERHEAAKRQVRGVARKVHHSKTCWFALFFLRTYFGILWTVDGHLTASPHSARLEALYPDGIPPDGQRPGETLQAPHGPELGRGGEQDAAYKRGMEKWYAVPGMCVPCVDLPPRGEDVPPDWRAPYTIPQRTILKEKDRYKASFTMKPAKSRCVCDLRQVNRHWRDGGMRYTGHEHFAEQVTVGDYIAVVDISSFYLKVPLAEKMYRYFSFKDYFRDGRDGWQTHTRLPFGAGLSPYYACLVSAVALDCLRARGSAAAKAYDEWKRQPACRRKGPPPVDAAFARWGRHAKSTAYVDDIALAGPDREAVEAAVERLVAILRRLGMPAKDKEDTWEPKQQQVFLGMEFDTVRERTTGSEERCVEIRMSPEYSKYLLSQIVAVIDAGCFDAGTIATLVGCMGWAAMVMVGGRARLCSIYAVKSAMRRRKEARFGAERPQNGSQAAREAYYLALTYQRTEAEALDDLRWWAAKIADPSWTGARSVLFSAEEPITIMSDASGHLGWGYHHIDVSKPGKLGIDTSAPKCRNGHGWDCAPWTKEQDQALGDDMLAKEMFPILAAARRYGAEWTGRIVVAGADNTGAVYGINAGRVHSHRARGMMRELGDLQQEHQFELVGGWVPREYNVVADSLSRQMSLLESVATAFPVGG